MYNVVNVGYNGIMDSMIPFLTGRMPLSQIVLLKKFTFSIMFLPDASYFVDEILNASVAFLFGYHINSVGQGYFYLFELFS